MKVAVCDDLKECLIQVEKLLDQIPYVRQVDTYTNINSFYDELIAGKIYDVIFMDIDWKQEKNGIDFAEELQKYSPHSQIVYITAYTMEYIEDVVLKSSNLSGFLMKPVKMEQLEQNLQKIKRRQMNTDEKLLIKQKSSVVAVPLEKIIYLESELHKANIILQDTTYQCNEKLSKLKGRLNAQFLECHKSYLVNMEYIREFRGGEILLNTDETIPVSKAKAGEAKKRFFEYMARRM